MRSPRLAVCLALAVLACGDESAAPDAGAPAFTFEDVRVEELGATRAVVRFDTSVATSCEILWGLAEDALDQSATDPDMEPGELAIEHEVPLEDLQPDTTYYFRARGTDAEDRTELSELHRFTTASGEGADPTAGRTNVARISEGASVAEVSSNWAGGGDDSSFGILNAFDGSMATEWSSDGDGDEAFVVLDLGQVRTLRHLGYRSRKMSDGSSIVQSIQIVAGGETFGPFDTPDPDRRYVFPLPEVAVDQVRVEAVVSTGGNTGAKEIQLYE